MCLENQKLAICEKLPRLFEKQRLGNYYQWSNPFWTTGCGEINWQLEGLQICHEAEKLLDPTKAALYQLRMIELFNTSGLLRSTETTPEIKHYRIHATYEQRLEALCRVWWPERFSF